MAITNREWVGRALDLLQKGLHPFMEREMKKRYGETWQGKISQRSASQNQIRNDWKEYWDVQRLLDAIWSNWREVFGETLGRVERSHVSELIDIRNRWAHQASFSTDDTYRAIDTVTRLLTAISAKDDAAEAKSLQQEFKKIQLEEIHRSEPSEIPRPEFPKKAHMNNADAILDYLHEKKAPLCDDCLSTILAITPRQQINSICRSLSGRNAIHRDKGTCSACSSYKIVNHVGMPKSNSSGVIQL